MHEIFGNIGYNVFSRSHLNGKDKSYDRNPAIYILWQKRLDFAEKPRKYAAYRRCFLPVRSNALVT